MVSAVYCPDCGVRSNPHKVKCEACGAKLPSLARKNPLYAKVTETRPKTAVFDLDGTIFDNFQRFKDARRAGLIDKDGKPVQKGRQSMGAAWKKRNKFLYTKKNLAKDTLIPGVRETITSLTNDGYIIVYLTARPREYYTEILDQLESNGLPIFRDNTDSVLLITKPPGRMKASEYKGDEVRKLQGEFDVRMAFDDDLDALAEMSKYDVPGLYASVSDHVKVNPKVRNNPHKFKDPDAEPYDVADSGPMGDQVFVEDEKEKSSERTITADSIQTSLEEWVTKENPVKRGNDSKGGYYRWGKGKKYHYKTGSDRSRNIARKKAYEQAKAAYAGGYRKNPHKSDYRQAAGAIIMHKDQILLLRRSTKETSKHGMWELPGGKLEEGETPEQAAMIEAKEESGLDIEIKGKAGAHADHDNEKVYHAFLAEPKNVNQEVKLSDEHDESLWVSLDQALSMREDELSHHAKYFFEQMKESAGTKTNPTKKKKFKIHTGDISGTKKGSVYATVQVGRNIVMDVGEGIQDVYRGLIGGRQSMTEKRLAMGVAEMEKDLMDQAKKLGANAVSNLQIDYEPQYRGEVTILATGEAVKTRASVKKNPANPKKVEKGKKLYKHMNGQDPEKVAVEKIDIGDVWYKVGEGGCWQIGYMSGKETGKEDQKYVHTFNEETKDGNFPELYATMPENGKPMLIIKGGTWKIRTDDTGVAWIYD